MLDIRSLASTHFGLPEILGFPLGGEKHHQIRAGFSVGCLTGDSSKSPTLSSLGLWPPSWSVGRSPKNDFHQSVPN